MPDFCNNRLIINMPEGDDLVGYPQFEELLEFLAGTLRESAEYVFREADGAASCDSEAAEIDRNGLFWSFDFVIEDLGTRGTTLRFLTKSAPLLGWVRRIHERYPAWLLRYDFIGADCGEVGSLYWDGPSVPTLMRQFSWS